MRNYLMLSLLLVMSNCGDEIHNINLPEEPNFVADTTNACMLKFPSKYNLNIDNPDHSFCGGETICANGASWAYFCTCDKLCVCFVGDLDKSRGNNGSVMLLMPKQTCLVTPALKRSILMQEAAILTKQAMK